MVTREILLSHPVKYLRDEITKTNIMGFSTMNKDLLVDEMMKRKELFGHIVASGRKGRGSYVGKKQIKIRSKKERDEMKKTKRGRLAIIQERIEALPSFTSAGRMAALKAQLRAEKANKSAIQENKKKRKFNVKV